MNTIPSNPESGRQRRLSVVHPSLRVAAGLAVLAGLGVIHPAAATHGPAPQPYAGTPSPVPPGVGPDVPTIREVTGKEFSDGRDRDFQGAPDLERVIAWDGVGGVRDAFSFQGSRVAAGYPFPSGTPRDREVDGLSQGVDALFSALRNNQAAMVFSVEGDGHIHYVRPTGFPGSLPGHGIWATPGEIDAVHPPLDVDGLEVWGPDQLDDANRYSLRDDPAALHPDGSLRRVAIWAYNPGSHESEPHTYTSDLAAAIDRQFGGIGEGGNLWSHLVQLMDVDAIMTLGSNVTFSVAPLTLSTIDPGFPDFHGGEIFLFQDASLPTEFLEMGGYVWDNNLDLMATFGVGNNNLNALEAIAVPEPGSLILLGGGALCLLRRRSAGAPRQRRGTFG